jgi:3-phosphoshikimate 1-carboxyvinyltransferase
LSENRLLKIQPSETLNGVVRLPGDKSLSHRALIFAALAGGVSQIGNCLMANVTQAMIDCLRLLGVEIEVSGDPAGTTGAANVTLTGRNLVDFIPPSEPLPCRGSATTMRLLAGILAGQRFESTLDGNQRLRMRPMNRIVEPLRAKGAKIDTSNGNAPLTFYPSRLHASEALLPVASAQVKSALLLAGLFSDGPTSVIEPHTSRDHTERMLRSLGLTVEERIHDDGRHEVSIPGGVDSLPPLNLQLASDPSSAAFLVVAGLIVPSAVVTIPRLCLNPGRTGLFEVLISMAADLTIDDRSELNGEPTGTVKARSCALRGVTVEGPIVTSMIDEFPIFAVAATQAQGVTTVKDAAELRLKESDRIDALAEELNKMGACIETTPDGFVVRGPVKLKGARVNGRGDHRLAMSLAVAGLVAQGETVIDGWEAMNDSFPGFPQLLNELGARVEW